MTRCSAWSGGRSRRTGGDIQGAGSQSSKVNLVARPAARSIGSGSSRRRRRRSIDTTSNKPHQHSIRHLSTFATKSGRYKTIISLLSALKYPRRLAGASALLLLLLLLLSSSSSLPTATATAINSPPALNAGLQQKAASLYMPLAGNPKRIHSSSFINTHEQLHAAGLPLSMASRLEQSPTVDGSPRHLDNSFLLVSPLALADYRVDASRRIGRAATNSGRPQEELVTGYSAQSGEPTCKQLTATWRTLKLHYPVLVDYLSAYLFSNSVEAHLSHIDIGKILARLDKSLTPLNSYSMQKVKSTNSALIAKLASNPFYYNIFRRYIDTLNTPLSTIPDYLNRFDTPEYTTEKPTDKEVIYGRLIKHPNEWTNNHISKTNENLHYLKLLSKPFEADQEEQQQPLETQPEDATSMPMYGRVVLNPSELGLNSLLNRRRITTENLEKLRKLAGRPDLGYD